MDRLGNYTTSVVAGAVAIVGGAMLVAVNGILGFTLIAVGIVLVLWPMAGKRRPKAEFDGEHLHLSGPFADYNLDVRDIENVFTADALKPILMALGYGGHRYMGGEFVDDKLGGIYVAADKKIPLFIVVDAGDKRYVFNDTDLENTGFLFDRLRSAVEKKE